ncbi:MAG: lipid-A-disaccharide synthase, partial [Candidatus Omnitrophica bacterium]|nr:lipid-A-disaccharide synthase [Candidatus Omnitrophota bacterium]
MPPKKIYIIAGEASGDAHAAHLAGAIKKQNPAVEFYGLGGGLMKAEGIRIAYDLTQISSLGLSDVLLNYFKYRKIFYSALKEIEKIKPDAVLLVDFPGFNIRLAKKINRRFPIVYYISPQIWAWGGRRIGVLKKFVRQMIVFFPFEEALYKKAGIPCAFIGHPLTEQIPEPSCSITKPSSAPMTIGLLPGSRLKEVKRILPVLLNAAEEIFKKFPGTSFLLSESATVPSSVYNTLIGSHPLRASLRRLRGEPYRAIQESDVLVVTSGTATLETALHEKPHILVYRTAHLTYWLGRLLIRIPFLGIVNVLSGKPVSPELIQENCS